MFYEWLWWKDKGDVRALFVSDQGKVIFYTRPIRKKLLRKIKKDLPKDLPVLMLSKEVRVRLGIDDGLHKITVILRKNGEEQRFESFLLTCTLLPFARCSAVAQFGLSEIISVEFREGVLILEEATKGEVDIYLNH